MATRKPGSGPERRRAGTRAAGKGGQGDPGETPLRIGERFARVTAPLQLADAERRAQWGLPSLDEPDKTGPYIVELNLEHISGLAGAVQAFKEIHKQALSEASGKGARRSVPSPGVREPVPIAKSYYLCELKDKEWRSMVELDEAKPSRERAIYRLWPDFPVSAHTNRSMSTIKADAAMRSFDAAGAQIAWAVVDSGIDASHPHFGSADDEQRSQHALCCDEVVALHRCFADLHEVRNGVVVARPPLGNPDAASAMPAEERKRLLDEHRKYALSDDYGHGTHVAGIIAGQAPREGAEVWALEREFKVVGDDVKQSATYAPRTFTDGEPRPRGVAPRCRLVSLRVLDHEGRGRASRVIQALEFIRNFINDNPKKMRVHGVNLSVGYEYDAELFACGQSPLCTAVDRLVQEGVVVVTAAGNTGYGTAAADVGASRMCLSNSINDPGNAALAITVGATHKDSPHTYGVSYFSSKGPTGDGRMKPDLVAPGERIISCAAGKKLRDARSDGVQTSPDTGAALYIDDSGTSMAAPHVSGAIAAFLSIRREFIGKPLEVKRIFLESATPLGREGYFEGRGLVDLMRAIQLV